MMLSQHNNSNLVMLPSSDEPTYKEELQNRLREVVNEKFAAMVSDKKETPTLVIPKALSAFIITPLFYSYLTAIHDYLVRFNALRHKYEALQKKLSTRVTMHHGVLQSEKHDLVKYQKEITINYGIILLKYSSKQCKQDQFFFETLIYLTGRVMKSFFPREEYFVLEEELDRLFRSDKYNIVRKRHENDQILRQWPVLKNTIKPPTAKVNISTVLQQAEEKSRAVREASRARKLRSEQRNTISVVEPDMEDKNKRSPILSAYLPSNRLRMANYARDKSVRVYPSPDGTYKPHNVQKQIELLEGYE